MADMSTGTFLIFSGLWFDVHAQLDLYIAHLLQQRRYLTPVIILCNPHKLISNLGNDCERIWVDGSNPSNSFGDHIFDVCKSGNSAARSVWSSCGFPL